VVYNILRYVTLHTHENTSTPWRGMIGEAKARPTRQARRKRWERQVEGKAREGPWVGLGPELDGLQAGCEMRNGQHSKIAEQRTRNDQERRETLQDV